MGSEPKLLQGVILPDLDIENRGRYLVHIHETMPHIKPTNGIWCTNRTHSWSYNADCPAGAYGSYFPLQKGSRVLIRMDENNKEQGSIIEVVADQESNRLPHNSTPEQRDMITIPFKTPVYGNMMQINETTTSQPSNSIHLYFNTNTGQSYCGTTDSETAPSTPIRTKFIINEDGVHFCTADNANITIDTDGNIAINGKLKLKVGSDTDIHIKGDTKIHVDGTTNIYSDGALHIQSDVSISLQAPRLDLNGGVTAEKAVDNKGYNESSPEEKEVFGMSRSVELAKAALIKRT